MTLPPELANAAAQPVELTVAELLAMFGERNRDSVIVGRIEGELAQAELRCEPALLHGKLESLVVVHAIEVGSETSAAGGEETMTPATLRIADLPTARMPKGALISLQPGDDLLHARMVMLDNYFSQLPVMSGPYMLDGVVSWQSIALAHARGECASLADATQQPAPEVSIKAELLVTIPDINRHNCVFVRDEDQKISGLVTAADLSLEFGRLTGPFLLLGEIERRLRKCVDKMCTTVEELREASGYGKANSPDDLTVGQIIRVFEKPDRWTRLKWELPHNDFVDKLRSVKNIRNDVAHFRPNPLTSEQRQQVEVFAGLVKNFVP